MDDGVAELADAEAEIDVVVGDGEVGFVEASGFFPDLLAEGHAGAGDGGPLGDEVRAVDVAVVVFVEVLEGVGGDTSDAEDDASVLDVVVWVEELGADDADCGADGVADHF